MRKETMQNSTFFMIYPQSRNCIWGGQIRSTPPISPITGSPNELKFGTDLSWVKLHGGSLDGFDSFTDSGAINEKLENLYFIQISSKWPFILINTQEGVRILGSASEPPCNSTQWRFMPNFSLIGPPVMGDMGYYGGVLRVEPSSNTIPGPGVV